MDIGTMAGNVNKNIMKGYNQIQAPIFENQLGDLVFLMLDTLINKDCALKDFSWLLCSIHDTNVLINH